MVGHLTDTYSGLYGLLQLLYHYNQIENAGLHGLNGIPVVPGPVSMEMVCFLACKASMTRWLSIPVYCCSYLGLVWGVAWRGL